MVHIHTSGVRITITGLDGWAGLGWTLLVAGIRQVKVTGEKADLLASALREAGIEVQTE